MTVLEAILAVFTAIGEWFTTALPSFFSLFYVAETGLTFLGVLATCGLGFSIVFLNYLGHFNREVIHESTLIAGNTF